MLSEINAHVVSVFVGSKDAVIVEKTLVKNPFKGCELLLRCSKKTTPMVWQQTVTIHKQLSEATRAVRIVNANDEFLLHLKTAMDNDTVIRDKFIDIARKGFQNTQDVLYVQCHKLHKETLSVWIKQYIERQHFPNNSSTKPKVDDGARYDPDKSAKASKGGNEPASGDVAPLTKFHYMLNNESFRATSIASGNNSRGKSQRSQRSRQGQSFPTHVDLDVMSWAGVVKKGKEGYPRKVAGDNSSLQSAESDRSTIQSFKSQREQELEDMVDKLSIENNKLKKSQRAAMEAQQALLKANKELADQMSQVQLQLATVKDDIREEFDQKLKKMFQILNFTQHPDLPSTYDQASTPPRQTKMKARENSIISPIKKKQDNKSTPMQTNPFAADNPNRDQNMRQYLTETV